MEESVPISVPCTVEIGGGEVEGKQNSIGER